MSLHSRPEHNTPPIKKALVKHGMEPDGPSMLSDGFRLGWAAALEHTQQKSKRINWRDDPMAIVEDDEPQVGRDYE